MLVKLKSHPSNWIPILLVMYNFFANLANDIYLPSMPKILRVFSTNSSMVQLTMTAWFMGIAIPQLILGPLSDRMGRRPVLLGGSICLLTATLVCAVSPNIETFIVARFF